MAYCSFCILFLKYYLCSMLTRELVNILYAGNNLIAYYMIILMLFAIKDAYCNTIHTIFAVYTMYTVQHSILMIKDMFVMAY